MLYEVITAFLVRARTGDNGDVQTLDLVDLLEIDFREDQLLTNPQRVVAATVEALGRNSSYNFV